MKLSCLIVDDEPIARQIVESYCKYFSDIEVTASCDNAFEAKQIIEEQKIDLIFLDINMPVLDGMALMRTLRYQPLVIFTTAYKEFAHEAFDMYACDYLLKPFSLERFIVALDKAKERFNPSSEKTTSAAIEEFIYVNSDHKIFKILFDELLFAEANGNHVKIVTGKETVISTMTFATLESQLNHSRFIRLHRSFIINKSKISHIEGHLVYINKTEIPIGSKYRADFFKEIGVK